MRQKCRGNLALSSWNPRFFPGSVFRSFDGRSGDGGLMIGGTASPHKSHPEKLLFLTNFPLRFAVP